MRIGTKLPYRARNNKRRCVLCGGNQQQADIFDFYETLRDMEVSDSRYAHPLCVLDEQAARRKLARKRGTG